METKPQNQPGEMVPQEQKTPSKLRTLLKRIGWGVLGVLVFLALVGRFQKEVYIGYGKVQEYFYNIQRDKVLAEYAKDTIGGKTPEEVFDLLIDALKKGDIERAVGYYDLPLQREEMVDFQKELKEKGNLTTSLNFFETVRTEGVRNCLVDEEKQNVCIFTYKFTTTEDKTVDVKNSRDKTFVPKGSLEKWRVEILQNRFNGVWKIWWP